MTESPLFIADAMLGSLSKWLRILGFDTLYFKKIDDNELIRIAKQEDRMLLTRDAGLAKRKTIDNCILINSNNTFEQLKEVLLWVKGQGSRGKGDPRCTVCNGLLMPVDKKSVMDAIPDHIFLNCDSFFKCKNCGKIYWNGSHKKMMDAKIEEVLEESFFG
jgi:uncharacterized protein with PIN domain